GDRHAADADEWDRIVDEYARSYYVTPTDRLLRDLTADLSVLQLRLGGMDSSLQRGLTRVGGQLAAIAAVAWADAGEPTRAGRWWPWRRWCAGPRCPSSSRPGFWPTRAPCSAGPRCAFATPRATFTPGWATPAAPTRPRKPRCRSTRRAWPATGPRCCCTGWP